MTPQQREWVNALRSGRFQQGFGVLCDGSNYCSLGVACEIFHVPLGITKEITNATVKYDRRMIALPPRLRDYLNLCSCSGDSRDGKDSLMTLNDDGKTFEEIADAIETGAYFRPTEVG